MLYWLLKAVKWAAAVLAAALTVIYLPQIAIAFLVIPVVDQFENPYVKVLMGVCTTVVLAWIAFSYAELAALLLALQFQRFFNYFLYHYNIRLEEVTTEMQTA